VSRLAVRSILCLLNGLGIAGTAELQQIPVKDVVISEAQAVEQVPEELAQVAVVGTLVKMHLATKVQIVDKLAGEALAEHDNRGGQLLLRDPLVLLPLVGRLQALPGQGTQVEVHENIPQRFQVIATRLFNAQMCVNGGIAGGAREVLVFPIRNVLQRARVPELLGQAEVNDVHQVALLAETHEKVVRLNVAVDEVPRVDVVDAGDHLVRQQQNRLQREAARAKVEEVLQRGSEQLHHHHIVVALAAAPYYARYAYAALHRLVELGLDVQLGVLGADALQLDGHLLAGVNRGAQVDVAERSRPDLAAQAVFVAHAQLHFRMSVSVGFCVRKWGFLGSALPFCGSGENYFSFPSTVQLVMKMRKDRYRKFHTHYKFISNLIRRCSNTVVNSLLYVT